MANKHMKEFQYNQQGNANQTTVIHHLNPSEWSLLKVWKISVGKDAEKTEACKLLMVM